MTCATSTRSCTWTRWARSIRPGRAERHAVAPAPRLRDRHLHHRRHLPAPGLERRRRRHHQRRHAVDDRRRRHPAHRDAARAPGRVAAGCSTGSSCGSTCPAEQKWSPPRYQDIRAREVTLLSSPDGGALVRVIAGEVAGTAGPGVTHTPITLAHATLSPGARLALPWRTGLQRTGVRAGRTRHGRRRPAAGRDRPARRVRRRRHRSAVAADEQQDGRTPNLDVLILGGRPIREPVVHYGPFVMNTRDEIVQAFEDYQAGRLGQVPGGAHAASPRGRRRPQRELASRGASRSPPG